MNKRIIIFITGMMMVLSIRIWWVYTHQKPFIPQPTTQIISPPRQALEGKITEVSGKVEKISRNEIVFKPLTDTTILQGETLATRETSVADIAIGEIGSLTLSSNTTVDFSSLLPTSVLLHQSEGQATYRVTNTTYPLSIRVLHLLASLESGEIAVEIDHASIGIFVAKGQVKLALVDQKNNTNVWTVTEGHRVEVDDETRTVVIK